MNLEEEYVRGIAARKALSNKKPNIILGSKGDKSSGADVFYSRVDYARAIQDDRYAKSPEYRAESQAKLERTLKFGGFKE